MTELMTQFEGLQMFPVLLRLLARGKPVEMAEIAQAAGLPPGEVERLFTTLPNPQLDESGRLIGLGLGLTPTPHHFIVEGQILYLWCPTNALLFSMALGQPARLETTCFATGQPITIDITPDRLDRVVPGTAVITELVPPQTLAAPKTADFGCDKEQIFSSAEAAAGFVAGHPGAHVYPVAEEFDRCRWLAADMGWI